MNKLLAAPVLLMLLITALACGGEDDPDSTATATQPPPASPTQPSGPASPAVPSATADITATQAPSSTVAPEPTQPGVPSGTTTGDPDLDAVIEAVLTGDGGALVALTALTAAPCTTAQGLGGPPKCGQAPGMPADGTSVEAFPVSSCELGWIYDVAPIVTDLVGRDLELFAVLALDLPGPLFDEPYMPRLDHAVILESQAPGIGRLGHMLGLNDGALVYLESLCGAAPETYLTERQQIMDHHEVILRGPASQ
jgi:hypothetical protein